MSDSTASPGPDGDVGVAGFDAFDPEADGSLDFLLVKSAEHRRRLDTLREVLLDDEGHYGDGGTPSEVVYEESSMRVLRLHDAEGRPFEGPPVVFVPAPVSRYFILDLLPGRSFAGHVAGAGHDTYVIDFGIPGDEDRFADLEWYIEGLMRRAFRAILRTTGTERVNVIGYCLGGTFALLYTALHPQQVATLTVLTTLVDSSVEGGIAWVATRLGADGESAEHPRLVPAATVKSWFETLAPGSNSQEGRLADLLEQLDLPVEKLRSVRTMASWVDDVVPTPGRLLADISGKFGPAANELMTGRTTIGDAEVDLAEITMPVFSISASRDHISPPDGCDAIARVVPQAEVLRVPGGHVGTVAGSRAVELWDRVVDFIRAHPDSAARAASASPTPHR